MTVPHLPCSVYELRQYTLRPGRRDELIELFDAEFVESQEQVGMHVIGQFRDVDRDDRFVWLRGFPDMAARPDGLTRFYLEGRAWREHGRAANATMIDSDDVLLLRAVPSAPELCTGAGLRPARGQAMPAARYVIDVHHLHDGADAAQLWHTEVRPAADASGTQVVAVLRSEHAPNDFPQLPVRADADVLVVIARAAGHDELPAPAPGVQRLILEPTARSALR